MPNKYDDLQRRLGHKFTAFSLLEEALTHSSWANEAEGERPHNERLEYLGDAVLELCVSARLFALFPLAREGDLTRLRARLVNEGALAAIARDISLDKLLRLGVGEEKQGGRRRDALLADAFEALLAAAFLDGGFDAAKKIVDRLFAGLWPETWRGESKQNVRNQLQALAQNRYGALPVYEVIGQNGPEHAKIFEVRLRLPDGREFCAKNTSCKKAEQSAAALALDALQSI